MTTRRQRKVAEAIHKEISLLLQHRIRDPRLSLVNVTGVEVSPDLRLALVYVTSFEKHKNKLVLKALSKANGYLRRELGQALSLRHVPELNFKIDTSAEQGQRIDELIDLINHGQEESSDQPSQD